MMMMTLVETWLLGQDQYQDSSYKLFEGIKMEDFEEMNQELLGMRNFIDTRYFGQVYYGKGFAFVYLREAEITIVTTEAKNGEQSNAEQSFSYKDVLGAA